MTETIDRIPLEKITPHPGNRTIGGFDNAKLEQLAQSIRMVGVQQPAVVRPWQDGFQLVAGERRWRASKLAGIDFLPCVVRDLSDADTLKIQIIENLQREDVHPLDEADGYARLRDDGGYTPELIAQEVGRSLSYVYQRMRLEKLVPAARRLLVEGEIQAAHAVLIARLEPEQQEQVCNQRLGSYQRELGITARQLDEWIRTNIIMDLNHVAWKLNDATLAPEDALSCDDCPKRTGAVPALFDDLGLNHCTDAGCFEERQAAIIARNRAKAELVVAEGYWVSGPAGKGVLTKGDWEECKKSDEGALRVCVIDGAIPGRLAWGRKIEHELATRRAALGDTDGDEDEEIDPKEQARRDVAAKLEEGHRETNRRIFEAVLEVSTKYAPVEILRVLALQLFGDRDLELVGEYFGWTWEGDVDAETVADQHMRKMTLVELVKTIVAAQLIDGLNVKHWDDPILEGFKPWIEAFGIDAAGIRASVHEELGVTPEAVAEDEE